MSYQVLARKYRPRSFETLVGQEHVVRALTHALEQKRLHHAYLFTGTRGVGKTTLSRILAKSLNCQGLDGQGDVTASPCGSCDACVAIDAGRFVDYIEMDAASNRGVEEMAQLLEQAVYAPSNARYKIYMIDEVHMLSNHAFNAMLKTLEEPPEHVKFILATTDPQKIPVTVLSRCLQFNLKQMPPGHIIGHLDNILGQEGIAFETGALRLLAQGAQGSMRDALSLTDQAIAYSAGAVTLEAVQGMLGALDQSYLIRLLDALVTGDGAGMIGVADEMAERSLSYQAALQDLGSLLHRIALAQSVPAAIAEDLPEREQILRLAALFDPEELQLQYQIAVHGRNELGLAPDEYAGFTMTLLRMLAFRPLDGSPSGTSLPSQPQRSLSNVGSAPAAARAAAAPSLSVAPAPVAALSAHRSSTPPAAVGSSGGAGVASGTATAATAAATARQSISPARAALEAARGLGRTPAQRVAAPAVAVAVASAPMVATAANESVAASSSFATSDARVTAPAAPGGARPIAEVQAKVQAETQAETQAARNDSLPPWEDMPAVMPMVEGGQKKTADETPLSTSATLPAADINFANVADTDDIGHAALMVAEPASDWPENMPPAPYFSAGDTQVLSHAFASQPAPSAQHLAAPLAAAVIIPGYDADWPALATSLPLRGVVQQLALQSELMRCETELDVLVLLLRIPVDVLRSAGGTDKLEAALAQSLSRRVRVDTEIGAVRATASAAAAAAREQRQREAEEKMQNDPFVQTLMREFGASIVPGSVRPN